MRRQSHRSVMGTVPAPNERNQAAPSRGLREEPHGCLARIGAGEPEPDLFLPIARDEVDQPLGQLDRRAVDPGDEPAECRAPKLGGNGRPHPFVAVAQPGEGPRRAEIEIGPAVDIEEADRKSTRLNSSHANISYAVFCLKKKKKTTCITP